MTLAELKDDIQKWLMCSEATFVAKLDELIISAEKRIHNRLMMPDAKTVQTVPVVALTGSYAFTADVVQMLRVWLTVTDIEGTLRQRAPLIRKPVSWIREVGPGCLEAEPQYYAWVNSTATQPTVILAPTPNTDATLNVEYIDGTPPSLTVAETWLSKNYPDVLRKMCLHEGAIYLKNADLMDRYKVEAEEAASAMAQVVAAPQKDEYRAA